jgi:hypothetical protein
VCVCLCVCVCVCGWVVAIMGLGGEGGGGLRHGGSVSISSEELNFFILFLIYIFRCDHAAGAEAHSCNGR